MTFLPIISLLIAFTLVSAGQPPRDDRKKPERNPGQPRGEGFMKAFDTDKDGKVSREEFEAGERTSILEPETREKIFKRLDKDGDGFISRKEVKNMAPQPGRPPLHRADLNKDGRISFEEFSKHPPFADAPEERRKKMFARLDRNKDQFIDHKDGGLRHKEKGMPRIRIKALDKDRDGKLSWEEFREAPELEKISQKERKRLFDRIDTDKDGLLVEKETRARFDRPARGGEPKRDPKK